MTPKNKKSYNFPKVKLSQSESYTFPLQNVGFYGLNPYFSFKKYHHDNPEFNFSNFNTEEICIFFEELKNMSDYKWEEIFNRLRSYYHAHKVDWNFTAYEKGFKHDESITNYPVYQFKIHKQWRVFGYFNHHNIFKIVWVDKKHLVYPWDR